MERLRQLCLMGHSHTLAKLGCKCKGPGSETKTGAEDSKIELLAGENGFAWMKLAKRYYASCNAIHITAAADLTRVCTSGEWSRGEGAR